MSLHEEEDIQQQQEMQPQEEHNEGFILLFNLSVFFYHLEDKNMLITNMYT